jgi:signal transduction histidine kinase/ligand-binding sensor domain-containing protein
MKNTRTIFYLFLQFSSLLIFSQNNQIGFDHIGVDAGLSQKNILCITQDSRGFMWFGSWEGLNKYDGYKITVFKNDPKDPTSISNNYVNSIAESKNGDLWVATNGGGLCRFDRNKEIFKSYRHNAENTNSISNDLVNSVIEDANGMVWIGTQTGLDRFDPVKNKFEHFVYDPNNANSIGDSFIKYIFKDSHNALWIGTLRGGLNLFNPGPNTFTRYIHDEKNEKTISGNDIYAVFEDSKKQLWVGTNGNGLNLFNPTTGSFVHFKHNEKDPNSLPNNVVLAMNEDIEGNLWISTENGGISFLDYPKGFVGTIKSDEIDRESITNNSVYTIYKDVKNNMWIGNFAGGVDMASRDKSRFTHYRHQMLNNSLSNNQVLSIMEDRNKNIWIATDGGGLNLFNPRTTSFTHYLHDKNNPQSIISNNVLTTMEDSKGNIWIGTWAAGITVFNPEKNTYKHFQNEPGNDKSLAGNNAWKIFEDKDHNIWIGTFGNGLDLYNPSKSSFTHYKFDPDKPDGISTDNIVNIFEDSEGLLWICGENGGTNVLNKKTNKFTHFLNNSNKNSISNNSANSVLEDDNKDIWIGTMMGLNKYNKKTHRFTNYTMADGLPGDYIFGLLQDDKKNIWISTNQGVSCFNPNTRVFKNYDVSDGLQSNEFKQLAYCRSTSGMMYFGGINGFNQFYPDAIHAISFEPPLVLTNFQLFNKKVSIATTDMDASPLLQSITETRNITLPYSNAVFSFEFATLNYTNDEKKQYAYMLEGFDKGWNEVGSNRTATYTHLDPGTYQFKVKGLNNDGAWSSKQIRIQVVITPPYWLTWWFKLGVFLVVTGTVFTIYFIRIKDIKTQKEKLQQQVTAQTRQLVISAKEEHKARTAAENAHHETALANNELKIKNKELEQFAYVASHDLQEPLRTTIGFVELIQKQYRGRIDEKADKYLDFIADASDRMRVLIKDLLDFSRIGANGELERVDCNEVLKNTISDLMLAIDESKATIHIDSLPVIIGDPTEVKILFQNLLINAIKFRKKEVAPIVQISAKLKEGFWEFAISDNGIGIQPEHSHRIFDIFQRLHTRSEYAGSGIGLSHCKKIVGLHNGKIWVESTPGEGSTFYFTLPAGVDSMPKSFIHELLPKLSIVN